MKPHIRLLLPLLILTLFLCKRAEASIQLTYTIEVNVDGSAVWTAEQKGIGIPPPVFDEFVRNVSLLIALAAEKTQRNMTVERLSMSVNVSGSYKIIRYYFTWKNFTIPMNGKMVMGDMFQVENLFSYLYGDGAVCILYPSEYFVETVSPEPHERNEQFHILKWYGTADFKIGEPKVTFTKNPDFWITNKNIILIFSLTLLAGGGVVGIYYLKFKRKRKMREERIVQKIESDEEKVISLLKSAGGSLYQSAIADYCGFSRAKASKLLKTMEDKGMIKREDKGREKIVTLLKEVKK